MNILNEIIDVSVYSVAGIVLMLLGSWIIDLIIPCSFPDEIKKGNKAVGFLCAGSFIGFGTILRAAISSLTVSEAKESLVAGLGNSAIYFILGTVYFILGYIIINAFHKQYDLSNEIGKGNMAAGITICGIFIGLAQIIAGVIS